MDLDRPGEGSSLRTAYVVQTGGGGRAAGAACGRYAARRGAHKVEMRAGCAPSFRAPWAFPLGSTIHRARYGGSWAGTTCTPPDNTRRTTGIGAEGATAVKTLRGARVRRGPWEPGALCWFTRGRCTACQSGADLRDPLGQGNAGCPMEGDPRPELSTYRGPRRPGAYADRRRRWPARADDGGSLADDARARGDLESRGPRLRRWVTAEGIRAHAPVHRRRRRRSWPGARDPHRPRGVGVRGGVATPPARGRKWYEIAGRGPVRTRGTAAESTSLPRPAETAHG
jgi:hypothetical protein